MIDTKKPSIVINKFMLIKNSTRSRKVEEVYSYTSSDKLGQGSYGTVYKAVHKITGKVRAIKVIHKPSTKHQERLQMEVQTMQILDHPHIVHVYECFEDQEYIYMVQEICLGGDVFDKVIELGNFSEEQARQLFVQIMRAIYYYSFFDVVHRDLKPENFLFQDRNDLSTLNMIDFGLAKEYKIGLEMLKTKAGTAYYVAPEVLQGCYDNKCDIWSAGVILYVLCCGYPPFYGECESEVLIQIAQGDFQFDGDEWKSINMDAKELICNMITDHNVRYDVKQVIAHNWVEAYMEEEFLNKQLQVRKYFDFNKLRQFASFPVLKQLAILYISTQLDQEALTNIKQTFLVVNKSQTGQVTIEEVQEFLNSQNYMKSSQIEIEKLFNYVNFSDNNSLNYSQFVAICLPSSQYLQKDNIQLEFYFLQSNEGPFIDFSSLSECLKSDFPKENTDAFIKKLIAENDINNDGRITFEQFFQVLNQGSVQEFKNQI